MKDQKKATVQNKNKLKPNSLFGSLTPKVITDEQELFKIQPYLDKLNDAIEEPDINNIALTGGYGSGKSTIIKTFNYHYKYSHINISLASFNKKENTKNYNRLNRRRRLFGYGVKNNDIQIEEHERSIETSILQQMIYKVNPEVIPSSRFKRILNLPDELITWKAVQLTSWIISLVLLFKFDYIDYINPSKWDCKLPLNISSLIVITISILGFIAFLKSIASYFSNSKITKVNLKGEIEVSDSNKSVLNEHLEEIIYFFEKTEYQIVFIEDLDRFDSTNIFSKLREINLLINNSDSIKRNVKFVYAVGDGLFKDKKERVKFFDFIIPIIPFIDSSNASGKIDELINAANLNENNLTEEFKSNFTTFIDDIDMRLLINIFNEFEIYHRIFKKEQYVSDDQLLAMIVYKNVDPDDFQNLNNRSGKLYDFISKKSDYIQILQLDLEAKIKTLENAFAHISEEKAPDLISLRAPYIVKLIQSIPAGYINDMKGFQEEITKLMEADNFEQAWKNINTNFFNFNGARKFPDLLTIQSEIDPKISYSDREKRTIGKSNRNLNKINERKTDYQRKLNEIEHYDLKTIFSKIDLTSYLKGFSHQKLIQSFILQGYISENYKDYISIFYPGSISLKDKDFAKNVKAGIASDYSLNLDNPSALVKEIELMHFSRSTIFNNDLLLYLLDNKNLYTRKANSFFTLLSSEKAVPFLDKYINEDKRKVGLLLEEIVSRWDDFFYYIIEESNFDRTKIDYYLFLTLSNISITEIRKQSARSKYSMKEMVDTNSNFVKIATDKYNIHQQKVIELIDELEIEFNFLAEPNQSTDKVFDSIYKNNRYIITLENIKMILSQIEHKDYEIENLKAEYFTIAERHCNNLLIIRIQGMLNLFISSLYLKGEDLKKENESVLIDLLNNKKIDEDNKIAIVKRQINKIKNLDSIKDKFLCINLFSENLVQSTWQNIYKIYEIDADSIDPLEEIVTFLNIEENAHLLEALHSKTEEEKENFGELLSLVLEQTNLELSSFKLLLEKQHCQLGNFEYKTLDDFKLSALIENKTLEFSVEIYNNLPTERNDLQKVYINKYKNEFLEYSKENKLEFNMIGDMLDSDNFSQTEILPILKTIDWNIITSNDKYFENALFDWLPNVHSTDIPSDYIAGLLMRQSFSKNSLIILSNEFERFEINEIKQIIQSFNDEEYSKYISNKQKKLKLENSALNDKLFEQMKKRNFITESSKKEKDGYVIYKSKYNNQF